jgi:hypothetical protein
VSQDACEAGVLLLEPAGWRVVRRRAFPDQMAALGWVAAEVQRVAAEHPGRRYRLSVVVAPTTLDSVLADYGFPLPRTSWGLTCPGSGEPR